MFYATESMNITDFFERNGLESIWTGIFRREDQKLFLDDGGFTPVTMTKTDRIDSSQLVLGTFADDMAVILKYAEKSGFKGFSYVPVPKTRQHRAVCLQEVPFPRKDSTREILTDFRNRFLEQVDEAMDSIKSTAQLAKGTVKMLPEAPTVANLASTKHVELEEKLTQKISRLEIEVGKLEKMFNNIRDPEDLVNLLYQHSTVVNNLLTLEGEILEPVFRPVSFVDDRWQDVLTSGSGYRLFANRDEKLVLNIEPPGLDMVLDELR